MTIEEAVAEVRDECRDDVLAADIAEALVRNAGMSYLDMTSPETAARIAATVARKRLHTVPTAITVQGDVDHELFEAIQRYYVERARAAGAPEDLPLAAVAPLIIVGDARVIEDDAVMRQCGWVRLAGVRAEVEHIRSLGADEGHVIETGWPEATAAFDRLWEGSSADQWAAQAAMDGTNESTRSGNADG